MLRNLLDDVTRRRMWPLVAVAALAVIALPLLFLRSAPSDAPAADTAAPAMPQTAKLPARAARLLETSDSDASKGGATGTSHDPFTPPRGSGPASSGASKSSDAGSAAKSSSGGSSPSQPKPATVKPGHVVVPNPAAPAGATTGTDGSGTSSANALTVANAAVDIRFGKTADSPLHRAIPRLQAFLIRGKVAAVFVKYSPSRRKAVFAISPGMKVSGPNDCEVSGGVCRYVYVPAGSYLRIAMLTPQREVVRRRLDVEHITRRSAETTVAAASTSTANACYLHKIQAMRPGSAYVDRDACAG